MSYSLNNDLRQVIQDQCLEKTPLDTFNYLDFTVYVFDISVDISLIDEHSNSNSLYVFLSEKLEIKKLDNTIWILSIPESFYSQVRPLTKSYVNTIKNSYSDNDYSKSFSVVLEYLNAFSESTYGVEILDYNQKLIKYNNSRAELFPLNITIFDIIRKYAGQAYFESKITDSTTKVVFFKSIYDNESKLHFRFSTTPVVNSNNKIVYYVNFIENITKQKEIENNLLTTNRVSDEGLLIHQNLKIIYANEALVKLIGYNNLEEFKNKNLFDFIEPEYHTLIKEKINSNAVEKYQITGIKKDGTKFPLEIKSVANDLNDTTTRTVSIRDISVLNENIEQLKQKNQELNFIYNNISDVISIHGADSSVIYVTPSLLSLTGYTLSQVKGYKAFERVNEEFKKIIENTIKELYYDQKPKLVRFKFQHKEGHYIWLESTINLIEYKNSSTSENKAFVCVTRNIEHEVKKEKDLEHKASFQKLLCEISKNFIESNFENHQLIIQNSLNLIGKYVKCDRAYVIDFNYNNHTANNSYEWVNDKVSSEIENTQNIPLDKISLLTDQLYQGNIFNINDVSSLPASHLKSILNTQNIKSILNIPLILNKKCIGLVGFDMVLSSRVFKDSEIDLLIIYAQMLVNYREREKVMKSFFDKNNELNDAHQHLKLINSKLNLALEKANKSHQLEEALNQLKNTQASLLEREKLASIGVLTAGVAHEINNPLNFIKGGIIALENFIKDKNYHLNEETKPYFEMINSGVSRTTKIVKSLNRFNRTNNQMNELCDINLIINNCLIILNNKLKHKIDVIKHYSDDIIIKGNEGQMHQMFTNILSNSEQAINSKGFIRINTKIVNDKVVIIIEDSGCGISNEKINRVFEPFYTTKDPGKGTGLGLSIVYNIVKNHEGNIEINSSENIGTKLKIIFDRAF